MQKLPFSPDMADIDRKAQSDFSYPSLLLMENAGSTSWFRMNELGLSPSPRNSLCVFIAGKGNNGGDAFVMARQCFLSGNPRTSVIQISEKLSEDSRVNRNIVSAIGVPVLSWEKEKDRAVDLLERADFIFDGIAGTGIKGALRGVLSEVVEKINSICRGHGGSRGTVVAIDVPSGVGDDFQSSYLAVKADVTLTMGLPMACLYLPYARPLAGRIEVIPLGFPPALTENPEIPGSLMQSEDLKQLLPIGEETYKNKRGHLAVFAGSEGTTGAALLSAEAAGRSRAGLVSLFPHPTVYEICAGHTKSVMTKKLRNFERPKNFDFSPYQALILGPGWGTGPPRDEWLCACIASGLPGVLDADGITLAAKMAEEDRLPSFEERWVLTPHPGECARISGRSKEEVLNRPYETVIELSQRLKAVVVLKTHVVIIGNPDGSFRVVDGMNPAMATGGSGDILSGVIGGMLATGIKPGDAAAMGALLHQQAGKRAGEEKGWFLSEALLPYISLMI